MSGPSIWNGLIAAAGPWMGEVASTSLILAGGWAAAVALLPSTDADPRPVLLKSGPDRLARKRRRQRALLEVIAIQLIVLWGWFEIGHPDVGPPVPSCRPSKGDPLALTVVGDPSRLEIQP